MLIRHIEVFCSLIFRRKIVNYSPDTDLSTANMSMKLGYCLTKYTNNTDIIQLIFFSYRHPGSSSCVKCRGMVEWVGQQGQEERRGVEGSVPCAVP